MSELDKIEAERPNIVVEGKGRLKREYLPSAHTFSKIVADNTTNVFNIQVFNDNSEDMSCELDKELLFPTGWTVTVKDKDSAEITTFPHAFTITKESYASFTMEVKTPLSLTLGHAATLCIFVKNIELDSDYRDSFKIINSPVFLLFTDVQKEIEMLIDDESIHPSTATYSAQQFTDEVISRESSIILCMTAKSLWGKTFSHTDLAREVILGRIISRTLRKAAAYSLGGEKFYITLAESYDERTETALSKLMSRCMGEGMQSKAVRVIPTELTNIG